MTLQNRPAVLIFGLLVLLSCVLFYQFGAPFAIEGRTSILNLDTFLYTQYAKVMADGHPYQFNEADPPTTGTTSHLYPIILSLFYLIGFKGMSLLGVLFWLNTAFLIGSAICFWFIAKKICPKWPWIPALLFLFSGQTFVGVLGLSEAGLFLFLSMLTWCAALYKRHVLQAVALFLLALTRIEGMIIVVVYGVVLLVSRLLNKDSDDARTMKSSLWVFLSGIAGVLLVLILHLILTGRFSFDSTLGKGFFVSNHWLTAINIWIQEIIRFFREIFTGSGNNIRLYYMIPLVSGIFILYGLFRMPWNRRILKHPGQIEIWWLTSILLTILLITLSGSQEIHYDRYIVWIIPLFYLYMIRGVSALPIREAFKKTIFGIFILYQVICFPIFMHSYLSSAGKIRPKVENIQKLTEFLPKTAKVAVIGGSGIKYIQPGWYVLNLGGVTVPYFRDCPTDMNAKLKVVERCPNLRFDYFIQPDEPLNVFRPLIMDSMLIEQTNIIKSSVYVYRFDWDRLLSAKDPLQKDVQGLLQNKVLIDHIDIGDVRDEKQSGYRTFSLYKYETMFLFLTDFTVDGKEYADVVRGVLGMDAFTLKTRPDRDHWLVIRSIFRGNMICNMFNEQREIVANMKTVKQLTIEVNRQYEFKVNMEPLYQKQEGNLFEWAVRIPKEAISGDRTQIAIYGDHYVCDYWLYSLNE